MTDGRPTLFQIVTEWGTPWLPALKKREEQRRGGRYHPSVTVLNDQAGRLGIKEKISLTFARS